MIAKVREPRTSLCWIRYVIMSFLGLLSILFMAFLTTHSEVSVYQFSDADTPLERQQKLEKMSGFISKDPNGTHSISYTMKD